MGGSGWLGLRDGSRQRFPLFLSKAPRAVLRVGPQPRPNGLQEESHRPCAHEPHHTDAGAPGMREAAAGGGLEHGELTPRQGVEARIQTEA